MTKGGAHVGNHRLDETPAGLVDRAPALAPVASSTRRLTVEQAAEVFQFTTKALYAFLSKRPHFPGVLRFGRVIRIDQGRFEAGLRQLQMRRVPERRRLVRRPA